MFGSAKGDRAQFSPLASPDSQGRHNPSATYLQRPPKEIRRYRMRVEGRDEQVDKVDRKRKVEHEFRARDKQEYKENTLAQTSI
jgi:hypothetical protein